MFLDVVLYLLYRASSEFIALNRLIGGTSSVGHRPSGVGALASAAWQNPRSEFRNTEKFVEAWVTGSH